MKNVCLLFKKQNIDNEYIFLKRFWEKNEEKY